jgi:hypothetical protein
MLVGIFIISACTNVIPAPKNKDGFIILYIQKRIPIENNKTTSAGDASSPSIHNLNNNILINESHKDIKIGNINLPQNASIDLSDKEYSNIVVNMPEADFTKIFDENNVKILKKNGILKIVDK